MTDLAEDCSNSCTWIGSHYQQLGPCLPLCSLVLCPVQGGQLSRKLPSLFGHGHLTLSLPLKTLSGCQYHLSSAFLEETRRGLLVLSLNHMFQPQFNENLCSGMRSTSFLHTNQMGHVLLSHGVYFHQEHLRGENPRQNSGIPSPLVKQQLIILLSHSKPYNLLSLLILQSIISIPSYYHVDSFCLGKGLPI